MYLVLSYHAPRTSGRPFAGFSANFQPNFRPDFRPDFRSNFRPDFRRGHGGPKFFVIQIKRKLKRKRKQKRKQGSLREGREAPPRRCPPLLRFCFRFRFNLRLIWILKSILVWNLLRVRIMITFRKSWRLTLRKKKQQHQQYLCQFIGNYRQFLIDLCISTFHNSN